VALRASSLSITDKSASRGTIFSIPASVTSTRGVVTDCRCIPLVLHRAHLPRLGHQKIRPRHAEIRSGGIYRANNSRLPRQRPDRRCTAS
jgi:hypothetical protein